MLVSVMVPAYNEEKYVGACLDALCAQEQPGFEYEVIVVDDGSTDRTREIALAHDVRVISQPNGGVAKARQAGFEAARGEIVASTDADTLCPSDWLARVVVAFHDSPELVGVYGPVRFLDCSVGMESVLYYGGVLAHSVHSTLGRPAFSGANFGVRRDAWNRVGGFNVEWASSEDISLSLKLRSQGRIRFDRHLTVYTSSRRIQAGRREILRQYGLNYVRVFWLNKPGLPFSNIR